MSIRNLTQNTIIAQTVRLANTPLTRMCGLLGVDSLAVNHALLITPCQSVHMLFMRFAIDVIFLNKNNDVVGLCHNLAPFAFSPIFWKSACAIELPAGTIEATHTQINDRITLN